MGKNVCNYNVGKTFLAPKKSQVLRTKGIVRAGSPYGKSQVLVLAVSGTVKQAAAMPEILLNRLSSVLNTVATAIHANMAL